MFMQVCNNFLCFFHLSRKKQLTYNDTSAHDRAFLILHRCTAPSFRIGRNFACVLFFTLFY